MYIVLIDFGSTFTKVAVVSGAEQRIIHTDRFFSTIHTDAKICLEQCFDSVRRCIGHEAFENALKLSSSSAAGGLRMAVIGLSPTLSSTAGRNAAFGAGAKIMATLTDELGQNDIHALLKLDIEIILFCGGYENGSTEVLKHNAFMLAQSSLRSPVIYAGNSQMAQTVRRIFTQNNKEIFITNNVIPDVGKLDTASSEKIIRNVFLNRIINMKGLSQVQDKLDQPIIPTPAAVLTAGELLARGNSKQEGLGPLMIVDIGGATTDIHSYIDQTCYEGARQLGSPEPYARRTVEGDMGMRESSKCLLDEIGWTNTASDLGLSVDELHASIQKRVENINFVADTETEIKIDHTIAAGAVHVSVRRHAGRIEYIHSSNCTALQTGKNIVPIHTVIGTGGPLVNNHRPKEILLNVCAHSAQDIDILLPEAACFYLDQQYILYAAGLLKTYDDDLALTIMRNSLLAL